MMLPCNALIVKLQDGKIVLSAVMAHRKYLTAEQEKIIEEIATKKELEHTTEYDVPLPKDRNHVKIIILED